MRNHKIIIAGASQGAGHMKAAQNISNAFAEIGLKESPQIIDIFDYFPFVIKFISLEGWRYTSTNFHSIYDYLYRHSLQSPWKHSLTTITSKIVSEQLFKEYQKDPPDIFIATHAMAVPVGAMLKEKFNCKFYFAATDFIIHSSHIASNLDLIFIPAECEIMLTNEQHETIDKRIRITGIPIDSRFAQKKNINKLKQKLSLKPRLKTVLISFGGDGLKAMKHIDVIEELKKAKLPLQFIVLTGKDKNFNDKMKSLYERDKKVHIFGYKNNVTDFYAVADLFLGKAGGLSISEAIAMNLPMFFVDKMPGQEEFNLKVMTKMSLGDYTPNSKTLISKIKSYLNSTDYCIRKNFKKIARPTSSQTIARSIIDMN